MKNINVDRSIVCFGNRFLGKKAPEATTNQTIEVTKAPAEEKPDGTSISVGLMG
jgi:hypothetical protein